MNLPPLLVEQANVIVDHGLDENARFSRSICLQCVPMYERGTCYGCLETKVCGF